MSIMDFFKPVTPETPPAAAPVQPGNLPVGAPAADAPVGELAKPAEKEPTSPLDEYKELWQPNLDADGKPIETAPDTPAALNPEELQKIIGKADLTKAITPEDLAAITAGGEGANEALVKAMNSVAQLTLTQSTLATDTMIKQAVETATKATEARLAEQIRTKNLSDTLLDSNPIYSNPAVKPVIEAVQAQLAVKFPDATTAQLAQKAQDFVKAMGIELNPAESASPEEKAKAGEDWDKFMGAPTG